MDKSVDDVADAPAFALSLERLRSRRSSKWRKYESDVIPAWVADMDCATAPPVRAALSRLLEEDDYGYPQREGGRADLAVALAFSDRMRRLYGWRTDPSAVQVTTDLIQATFAAILSFSEPGDGVILHLPAYAPFHEAIQSTGRRTVVWRMRDAGTAWDGNVGALEALIDPGCRMLVLCNPQNPTGHVFTVEELKEIARIAVRHNLVVLSDEIHCDILFDGRRHVPIASLSPEIGERTVTMNSATKSFSIPGGRCAALHFGAQALQEQFYAKISRRLLGSASVFGVDATVAAWREGDAWLAETLAHLQRMRDRVVERLARDLPAIRLRRPEATYMAWLDCSGLGLNEPAASFFLREAKVAFNPGDEFDPARSDHCRLNFATSRQIIDQIMDRMVAAVASRRSP